MEKTKAYGICLYKISNNKVKILLCRSIISKHKWGFLKGVQERNETIKQTAKREFFEESSIQIPIKLFEQYFEQINKEKDIGIYLVNTANIKNIDLYFYKDTLKEEFICNENEEVQFFNINQLPSIKKKQSRLTEEIIDFLRNKNQFH